MTSQINPLMVKKANPTHPTRLNHFLSFELFSCEFSIGEYQKDYPAKISMFIISPNKKQRKNLSFEVRIIFLSLERTKSKILCQKK